MSKVLEKLDELLNYIEDMPTKNFCELIDSFEADEDLVASYAKLEKIITHSPNLSQARLEEWGYSLTENSLQSNNDNEFDCNLQYAQAA